MRLDPLGQSMKHRTDFNLGFQHPEAPLVAVTSHIAAVKKGKVFTLQKNKMSPTPMATARGNQLRTEKFFDRTELGLCCHWLKALNPTAIRRLPAARPLQAANGGFPIPRMRTSDL